MIQPDPNSLADAIVQHAIYESNGDNAAGMATQIDWLFQGERYADIIMTMALILSNMVEGEEEPKRSAIAIAVSNLARQLADKEQTDDHR